MRTRTTLILIVFMMTLSSMAWAIQFVGTGGGEHATITAALLAAAAGEEVVIRSTYVTTTEDVTVQSPMQSNIIIRLDTGVSGKQIQSFTVNGLGVVLDGGVNGGTTRGLTVRRQNVTSECVFLRPSPTQTSANPIIVRNINALRGNRTLSVQYSVAATGTPGAASVTVSNITLGTDTGTDNIQRFIYLRENGTANPYVGQFLIQDATINNNASSGSGRGDMDIDRVGVGAIMKYRRVTFNCQSSDLTRGCVRGAGGDDGGTHIFEDCKFIRGGATPSGRVLYWNNNGPAPNVTFRRCTFTGQTTNTTAITMITFFRALTLTFEDCVINQLNNPGFSPATTDVDAFLIVPTTGLSANLTMTRTVINGSNRRAAKILNPGTATFNQCLFTQANGNLDGNVVLVDSNNTTNDGPTATFTNCIFHNQNGTSAFDGLTVGRESIVTVNHSTFVNCAVGVKGGQDATISGATSTVTLTNSLFKDCTVWGSAPFPGSPIFSMAGSFIHLDNSGNESDPNVTESNVTTGATGVTSPAYDIALVSTAIDTANASAVVDDYDETAVRPRGAGKDRGAQETTVLDIGEWSLY